MQKLRTFQCPDCSGKFSVWLEKDAPLPDFCMLCKADMGEPIPLTGRLRAGGMLSAEESRRTPTSPLISKPQHQSLDRTYRMMESSSEARAKDAADMLGVSVSEVSDIKVTNMKDNIREGESSAMTPPVSSPAIQPTPMVNTSVGSATAAMTRQGPVAGAGNSFLDTQIRRNHVQRAAAVQRNGQQGSFSG